MKISRNHIALLNPIQVDPYIGSERKGENGVGITNLRTFAKHKCEQERAILVT